MDDLLCKQRAIPGPLLTSGRIEIQAPSVALLTGGIDKPYVLGLTTGLTSVGIRVDVIGSDDLEVPQLLGNSKIRFLNLRGDQCPEATFLEKTIRLGRYYLELIGYVSKTEVKLLHILWNNRFETFDRTALLFYYRLLRKRIVFTAHNVNAGKRDLRDSWWNRLSLKIQYGFCNHIFVHTLKSKQELISDFQVPEARVTVIPFGINNTVPTTSLSTAGAKEKLGIAPENRSLLFFGQIAPYKGLEYLVRAFAKLAEDDDSYRLTIAGKPKWSGDYWVKMQQIIADRNLESRLIKRIEHIPDDEVEVYLKAADVMILPYSNIFQSGVLFLAYSFGLPVIATDVGSLKEEILEGQTGFVCAPQDSASLEETIRKYFKSDLFRDLEGRRSEIKAYANERYSWSKVAGITSAVYSRLLAS